MKILKKALYYFGLLAVCIFVLFSCGSRPLNNVSNNQVETIKIDEKEFTFRADYLKEDHFKKHKNEFNYKTADEYELGANKVIKSKNALIKEEKEDGDYVYYIEETNEIVFLSKDGYIRTYFKPRKGKKYFDNQ